MPSRAERRQGVAAVLAALVVVVSAACAVTVVACGSPPSPGPGSPSATTPPGPTPVPTPQITSGPPPVGAVAVTRRYWTLLGAGQDDAAYALTVGDHIADPASEPKVIESARYLRPLSPVEPSPGADATVEFASWVLIRPTASGSPFGTTTARWEMWSRVVRMSDGSWRLVELGTGP